eukprot:g6960.t1
MNPQQGGQNPQHPPEGHSTRPGGTPGYSQSVNSSSRGANRFLETPVQHQNSSNQIPAPAAPSRYHQYSIGSAVSGGGGSASAPRFGVGGAGGGVAISAARKVEADDEQRFRESNLPLTPTGGQPGGNPGSCIFGVHELAPQERSSSDGCNHDVEHDPEKFGLPRSVRQTPVGAGGPQGGARGRHSRTGGRGGEDVTGRPRDSFEFDLLAGGRGGAAEAKISSGGGGSSRSSSGGQQQQADRAGRAPKTAGNNSEASLIMVRKLRRKVQTAFQSHLHQTATFLADKVLCMTGDLEDLYTLAECYYQNREYARVIFLLTQKYAAEVVSTGQGQDRLKLLVVQSYLEAREFEEALRYLDEHCLPSGVGIERFEQGEHKAVFAFLKGKVFEHFENREAAVNCYKLAVKYDAYLHMHGPDDPFAPRMNLQSALIGSRHLVGQSANQAGGAHYDYLSLTICPLTIAGPVILDEATAKLIGTGLLTRSEEQKLLGKMRFEDEFLPVLYDFKSAASSSSWAGGPGGKAKGYVPGPEAAGRRAGLQELATGGKGAASSTRGRGGAVVPGEAATGTGGSSATGAGSSGANISSAAAGAEEDVTMGERNTLKNATGDYSTALAPGRTRRKRNSLEPLEDCKTEYPLTVLPENLHTNAFVLSSVAEKFFQTGDYTASYLVSKKILERDPYELDALPCHIASLLMVENKTLVFYIAHQLMNAYPHSPVAWFAAGCYYFMAGRYESARKFFGKATLVDHNFAPAWIAYGHAFAMQEESDQALAAYRTAGRLFPASHLPHLFLGMEYVRTSNLVLGEQALKMGLSAAPEDPALWNELGVCAFEKQDYRQAVELFRRAHTSLAGSATDPATEVDTFNLESSTTLESSAITISPSAVELEETVVDNLAHAYLKCGDYENALVFFQRALNLCVSATAYGGVAFVKQLQGDVHAAIEGYHKALALHPDDVFCQEMLNYAVQEAASMLTALPQLVFYRAGEYKEGELSKAVKSTAEPDGARAVKPFLTGALAGCMSASIMTPLDLIKVRQQTSGEPSATRVARSVLQADGFRGFYAGISAVWLRQIIYKGSVLGLYDVFVDFAGGRSQQAAGSARAVVVGAATGDGASRKNSSSAKDRLMNGPIA